MSLSINCEWTRGDGVRMPELAATWCRLGIGMGGAAITLIRDTESPHSVREAIDVSAYPLAEFLATHWWALVTPSHSPAYKGASLDQAGDGFPWPAAVFRSDRGQMWVHVEPVHDPNARVQFLTRAEAVLRADEVIREFSRFIDGTVRRLEDHHIRGTLLQEEWAAIQRTDQDEREFALAAASWGLDPYDTTFEQQETLLMLEGSLGEAGLVSELSRTSTQLQNSVQVIEWIQTARDVDIELRDSVRRVADLIGPAVAQSSSPWREGYRQARVARDALKLSPLDRAPIERLVGMATISSPSPMNIDALVKTTFDTTSAVVGTAASDRSRRFSAARALARRLTEEKPGVSLLTSGSGFTDRIERAFAAEFLAPAEGIRQLLQEDFGDESVSRVAHELGVSVTLIDRQIENQLAA